MPPRRMALAIRNKLLHAERWIRLSNRHCPTNAAMHGTYDAISLLVTMLREVNDPLNRNHRSDCKHCKAIAAAADKHN